MFPTKEAFEKQVEKMETTNAKLWRELKVNEIYRIDAKRMIPKTGKFGGGLILHISNADGNSEHVWATQLIAKRLLTDGEEKITLQCFIRPL